MHLMLYPALGILFVFSTLLALAFGTLDPSLLREGAAFTLFIVLPFWFYHRKTRRTMSDHVFFWASILMITHSYLNGIAFLSDTPIPRLKLYLKTFYLASIGLYLFAWKRNASRGLLLVLTILFSSNVLLSWYFLGFTLRSAVLAAYVVSGLLYALEEAESVRLDFRDALMFSLFGVGLLSTIFSWDHGSGTFGYIHLGLALPLYLLGRHLLKSTDVATFFRNCVFAVGGVMAMFAVFLLITSYTSGQPLPAKIEKIAGYHVNGLGAFVALFVPVSLYVAINDEHPGARTWAWLSIAMETGILVVITSRGSMVGVLVSLLIIGTQIRRIQPRMILAAALSVIVLVLVLVLLYSFAPTVRQYMLTLGNPESMKIRFMIWRLHVGNVMHYSPFLGFGADTFIINAVLQPADPELIAVLKPFMREFGPILHAHNVFVQLLQDFGLLGLFFSGLLCVSIAAAMWKALFSTDAVGFRSLRLFAFAALAALFVQGLFDYTLSDPMTYYPAVLILGIALQSSDPSRGRAFAKDQVRRATFAAGLLVFAVLFWAGWNRSLYISEAALFRGQILSDRFGNVTFLGISRFSENEIRSFQSRDRLFLPGNMDHRADQLAGEFFYQLYKKQQYAEGLEQASARFANCLKLHPYSAFCAWRLSAISREAGNKDEEKQYLELASLHDPYRLVIEQ